MRDAELTDKREKPRLPQAVLGTIGLCVLPFVLGALFGDLSSPPLTVDEADAMHRALAGSFIHTVLEWSAFLVAVLTAILAFLHYRLEGSPATPIIGMALFCAGALDVFHILAADRLIYAVADNRQFIPFTWALSRLWNALILIAGPLVLILYPRGPALTQDRGLQRRFVPVTCVAFAVFAYALVYVCARTTQLPQTLYPDAIVSRPWDVFPLLLFVVAAGFLYNFHRREPSVFTASLVLSCLPQIAAQATMAFGSDSLYDSSFNIAHGLKVVAYTIPFTGLVLDYVRTYHLARRSNEELEARVQARTEELHQAEAAAQAANRAKSQFLARMSHELRTPLNSILGYSQIFRRDDNLDERQHKGLDVIERSGEHLLGLINDILDLAKIEAGKLELLRRPFRLPLLLENIVDSEGPRARQRGLTLSYEPEPSLPDTVLGDDRRLRQILLNLLGNAIKFTQTGSVTLRAGRDEGETVRFEIHDTGVGIAREHLDEIFQPFEQAGEARHRAQGTGLGLAITGQLLHHMEGSIAVESEPGAGSLFTVTLPLPSTDAETKTAAGNGLGVVGYEGEPRKILVADDKAGNRAILNGLLTPLGFEIVEAEDGEEAIAKTLALGPDLILMDLVMPGLDGFETTRRLRRIPELPRIPIVALSASVFEHNQEASRAAGCDDFVAKPVRMDDLLQTLARLLALEWIHAPLPRRRQPTAASTTSTPMASALSQEATRTLLDMARRGAVREILGELDRLAKDENLAVSTACLRGHAEDYDMKAIRDILESWLEPEA